MNRNEASNVFEENLAKLLTVARQNAEPTFETKLADSVLQEVRRQRLAVNYVVKKKWVLAGATAAVILAVAAVGIVPLLKSPPAYALEQTLEALKAVRFLHVVGRDDDGQIVDERWIEVGPGGRQARYRQESEFMGMSLVIVDDRETCAYYDRKINTVVLYDPKEEQFTWIADLGGFFRDMAGDGTVTIEENVDYHGTRAHRVNWLRLNMDCYIDPETKLPMAVGPHEVFYAEPPAGTFDIAIPEGVAVVDKRPGAAPTQEPEWMADGKDPNKQFSEARHALAAGDYGRAAELFESVVAVQPARNWAWFWLGKAYAELGEYDAAIDTYSRLIDMYSAVSMVPHYCHLARGLAYRAKGMEHVAKEDFGNALGVMINSLRNIEKGASMLFDQADNHVPLSGGRSTREARLSMMIERLREVTGQNFGYHHEATPEEEDHVIGAWEDWWRQHAADYGVRVP